MTTRLNVVSRLAVAAGIALFPVRAYAQEATAETSFGVEDIIVTAQKREQNLQSVPVAVTALSAETLTAARFRNLLDIGSIAPGLSMRPNAGGTGGAVPSMRGIYGLATIGQDQGVAFYVDGVYISGIFGSAFDLADVERIEVLRGPQGTLFGRNSLGGAVSIITRDPAGEFKVHQELTYGNYDQFRSKTRVDLPQFGPLSVSVTYLHNQRKGDIRNLGSGTVWDYSAVTTGKFGLLRSPKRLGDQNVNAIAATAKLDLSPDLKLIYKFNRSVNNFTPYGTGTSGIDPNQSTGTAVLGILAAQPNPAILSPITRSRPDALNNAFATPGLLRTTDHNLTATYRLNDTISVKNILAFRKRLIISSDQLDGLGGLVSAADGRTPFVAVVATSRYYDKQWSNEFQLNVTTEWFDLTAGFLHFDLDSEGGNKPGTLASISFRTLPGFVIPPANIQPSTVKTLSDAVYVQNEIHITDQFDVTLGSRITSDRKDGVDRTFAGAVRPIRFRGDEPTYLAGVTYKPVPGILTYAKFSTGYISGGQLSLREYDASKAKSYEVGVKADWFHRRLRTNLALYSATYDQLQFLTSGAAFGIAAGQVIFNGGDAKVKGFEFEATAVPIPGLTLVGNLSYTDLRYKTVNPVVGNTSTFLPTFTPKWTASTSLQYETKPVVGEAYLQFRLDANYASQQLIGPHEPNMAPGYFQSTLIPSAWIINSRLALADFTVGGTKLSVAAWGRNLTNNRGHIGGASFRFLTTAIYQSARTYGLDLTIDY
jgi:iron complex outermembrane receptor protein